jgi:hypothetical protein
MKAARQPYTEGLAYSPGQPGRDRPTPGNNLLTQEAWDETGSPGPTGLDTFNGACAEARGKCCRAMAPVNGYLPVGVIVPGPKARYPRTHAKTRLLTMGGASSGGLHALS